MVGLKLFGSGSEERWGSTRRSGERANYDQNVMYERRTNLKNRNGQEKRKEGRKRKKEMCSCICLLGHLQSQPPYGIASKGSKGAPVLNAGSAVQQSGVQEAKE